MTDQLDTLLSEQRRFPAPPAFAGQANATRALYEAADRDRETFWAQQARALDWIEPWKKVLEWKLPHAKWFVGGKLNASANCLDRHLDGPTRNKAALIWEGEPGDRRVLTYWDLAREVRRCANALKGLGVRKGDRVVIYLPMVPEAVIAMLACARIGAVHSVIFGGFSAESVRDRVNDAVRRSSSPPMAGIAAARWCRSSGWPIRPWRTRRRSSTASWSAAGPVRKGMSRSPR